LLFFIRKPPYTTCQYRFAFFDHFPAAACYREIVDRSCLMHGLSQEISLALAGLGYDDLTEVQQAVIPAVLAGHDLIVSAPTGSGKTAAFAIPVCEQVILTLRQPQALVLTPTRELALQVQQTFSQIGRFKKIRCTAIFGKQSMMQQRNELRQRVHVVVGTPGRTLDHLEKGHLDLSQIRWLILDEADKMLEFGFFEQVSAIIERLPPNRTTLVFSATMPEPVEQLCQQYMRTPKRIAISVLKSLQEKIRQCWIAAADNDKFKLATQILDKLQPKRCILFCGTRERVDALAQELHQKIPNLKLCSLHGGMEQNQRLQTMRDFKRGTFSVLIATDVATRGIHVDDVTLVMNVDMPPDNESYIHRIGRTGRMQAEGFAIILAAASEQSCLKDLEDYLQYTIPQQDFSALMRSANDLSEKAAAVPQSILASQRLNRDISRIRINAGKKDKLRPGDILGAITAIPGVTATDTGIIDIQDSCSYVELFNDKGSLVLESLATAKIKGKNRSVRSVGFRET
jgi:superfamily II DNA/RNA helicase